MNKLIVIDGNSLLFRSYFATAFPGVEIMRNKDGIPTNAIFTFSNMIAKILSSLKEGEGIIVAFDAAKHNFRHDKLETYKANRKPAPEDLVRQFPIAREFLSAIGIYQFEQEGFEGDDIAGTIAKAAEKAGCNVNIFTSDRDFLQLVDDNITVNIIRKGLSDVVPMTPSLVKETYGFEPLQIIDYKGLRGDTSDNLPGIPGVGEKTAVELINTYGSFDNIIANADNIKGKLGEKIKANVEIGTISRDLAIIKTDIELPFGVADTEYKGYTFTQINEFCNKYGLKQFLNKVPSKWKRADATAKFDFEIEKIKSFKNIKIDGYIGLEADYDDRDDYYATELYGYAVYHNNHCYYIDIEDAQNDDSFKAILADQNILKYSYDFKSIKVSSNKYGLVINGLIFDLLIATYLLDTTIIKNPERILYFYNIDIANSNNDNVSLFSQGDMETTAKIAFYSYALAEKVRGELNKVFALELFDKLEIPLVNTLADMEIEGFPCDSSILDEFSKSYKEKLAAISKNIYDMVGEEFNISSPKQLGEILYNKLGLPMQGKGSTDADALKNLIDKHPVVAKILEYRKYFKMVSTYTDGLKVHIHDDGKLHASFNQALTQTGRLSSSNPNLQNISIRDEERKLIRKAFYYPDENVEILSYDYSQVELRILAHLSDCTPLIKVFNDGTDIHSATARAIFGLDGEPTSTQRRKAKVVNFGIVYGISDWGLSDELEISVKEARDIIDRFYANYPEISRFFQKIVIDTMRNGYVSTMLGRRRYLVEFHDSNYQTREFAKRAAMNAPIQGSAADLVKVAMVNIDKRIKKLHLQSKMVLQIHDELIFKVYKDEKEIISNLVKEEMTNALKLNVPLEVDGGFGRTWYDAK